MLMLEIGGVRVAVESSDAIAQSYEPIGGVATLRTLSGGALRQRNWRKLRTRVTVSDARWAAALAGLDEDAVHVMKCLAPRVIASTANAIALPAARRADVAPWGFALLADGFSVATGAAMAGNLLTLTPVTGAVGYQALFVPQLSVLITGMTENFDVRGAVASWDLTAEEV